MHEQLELIRFLQQVLRESFIIGTLAEEEGNIDQVDELYKEIYMQKMESEIRQWDEEAEKWRTTEDEYWY